MIRIVCNNYCGRTVTKDGDICNSCTEELEYKERIKKANIFIITYDSSTDRYGLVNKRTKVVEFLSNDELNGLYDEIDKAFKKRDDLRGYHE